MKEPGFSSDYLDLESPQDGEQGDYVFKDTTRSIWLSIGRVLLYIRRSPDLAGVIVEQIDYDDVEREIDTHEFRI